jgi:hypothetical protein
MAIRTLPVRVEIEQAVGRAEIFLNPLEQHVRPGDAIEWDFRYLGGADVIVDEVVIEFDSGRPFTGKGFRSRNPGNARPHRYVSEKVSETAAGTRIEYVIRARDIGKNTVAIARPVIVVGEQH